MKVLLDPDIVAAAIAFLDDEKMRRLELALVSIDGEHDPALYVERVSEFLLSEVGIEKLHEQCKAYKTGLRDASLYRRRH
jgi:hypothetical protein